MFCVKCGKQLADGVAFCTNCGNPIKAGNSPKQEKMHSDMPSGQVPVQPNSNTLNQGNSNLPVVNNPMYGSAPMGAAPYNPTHKKSSKVWIFGGISAAVVIVLAVAVVLFITKPWEDSSSRRSRSTDRASRNEEDSRVESKTKLEEEDEVTEEPKSRTTSKPKATQKPEASSIPSASSESRLTLDKADATKLITSLCYAANFGVNGNLLQYNTTGAEFCQSFMMNSLSYSRDMILKHYPEVHVKDRYLYIPEDVAKDYLTYSVGISDISALKANAIQQEIPQGNFTYYYNGVFMMMAPDVGDYICEEPVITEMKKISDSLYLISGSVKTGVSEFRTTTLFQIRMAVNPESVWGGFTLSSVDQWDTYLLPNSDSVFLTKQDLIGMDLDQLRLARNELYARHGRRFSDQALQTYFDSCNWYTGTIAPDAFNDSSMLNACEIANRDLIVQYEKERGF